MSPNAKYDWPDDQELQALLDEHGTVETARQVGCPPSSLKNRIRRRGLRGPQQRRNPDAANGNGMPFEANGEGQPAAERPNGKPRTLAQGLLVPRHSEEPADQPNVGKEPVAKPKLSEQGAESKPSRDLEESRSGTRAPFEHLGSADYLVRGEPRKARRPALIDADRGDDHASAERASRFKPALAFLRQVPPPIWRVLAVLALAAVAGIAAFISASGDPNTYQRESSFAVRPSPTVPPAAINDVLGTLAQPDSAVTETIVNMLGSPRLRNFAARSAGVPPGSVGGSGAEYGWSATRRTGSTIIDMRLTGPDDNKLRAMQAAAGPEAARLVEESYPPYRLETLSAPSPPVQVGPKVTRTVGLAILLGALLGITLVLAERRLRLSLAQREGRSRAPRGEPWER